MSFARDSQPISAFARHALSILHGPKQTTLTSKEICPVFHNPHIERGYRRAYKPKQYYIDSLFQIHNETLNVWTHIIAAFILIYKFAQTTRYVDYFNDPNSLAVLVFGCGAIECALFSAIAHLLHSRSEFHHYKYFQIDYAGVNLNGQAIGMVYMFFSGTELFYKTWGTYLVSWIHVAICFSGVVVMGIGKIHLSTKPGLKLALNLTQTTMSCLFSGMPLWYKLAEVISSNDSDSFWSDVFPSLLHYLLLGLGGLFYGAKIPEVFKPGFFDIVGQGHQIFHIFCSSMSLVQFYTIEQQYARRSKYLTSLAQPTIWNTVLPHICVMLSSFLFIYATNKFTKAKAKQHYEEFQNSKQNKLD